MGQELRKLKSALNRLSPKPIIDLHNVWKRRKSQVKRRLESILKEFDAAHRRVGLVYETFKDDLKKAKEAARTKRDKELVKLLEQLVTYWEGEKYDRLLEVYDRLARRKPTEAVQETYHKIMNAVERYLLPHLEKAIEKIKKLMDYFEQRKAA